MQKKQVRFALLVAMAVGVGSVQAATVKWYSNGVEVATQEAEAGEALIVPANPTEVFAGGYIFAGWATEPIDGQTATAPERVETEGLVMPADGATYYAVFAREEKKTDIANPNETASVELQSGQNEAAKFGLDPETWSATANKGSAMNNITLTNDTQGKLIRMYHNAAGGNTLAFTASEKIERIRISFTGEDYSKVWVKVNGVEITPADSVYAIYAESFTIGVRDDAPKQVRITHIEVVFYSASYATDFAAVTFEAPAKGTLVVKNGDEAITSGDMFTKGTTLAVEATPDPNCEIDEAIKVLKAADDTDVTDGVLSGSTLTMPAYSIKLTVSFRAKGDSTSVMTVNNETAKDGWTKILRHGNVLILRGSKTYTLDGQLVK